MKPNILVFVTDQQRADWLSCMGNGRINTPHIDAVAASGVLCTRAYCNTPLCMPSRATMWTGLPASAHGLRTNGVDLDESFPTLPGILRDNGYRTVSVGKIHLKSWHLSPEKSKNITAYDPDLFPECETVWERGLRDKLPEGYYGLERTHFIGGHGGYCFGEYLNWLRDEHPDAYDSLKRRESARPSQRPWDNYYSTVPNGLYYNEWIRDWTVREIDGCPSDQPFFLWCSFPDPHFPFGPPAPYCDQYAAGGMPDPVAWDDSRDGMNELYHAAYYRERGEASIDGGPTELTLGQVKETMALAYGMTSNVDDCVGKVMDHLRQSGRLENTIVVFLSDHGELMGDHGLFCKGPFHYEGLLRVPMVFSWPGHIREGARTGALVSILDFMPTLLDLAQIPYPGTAVPEWEGPFEGRRIYADTPRLPGRSLAPLLRGDTRRVQEEVLIEDDDDIRGVNLRTLIIEKHKLTVYSGRDYGELFDLAADPGERRNLWADPASAALRAQLTGRMLQAMIRQQPRLLRRIGIA